MYEEKIEELIKQHDSELSEEKRTNNNRVEALLTRLAECNSRYCDLMPDYEQVSASSTSTNIFHLLNHFPKFKFFWSDNDYWFTDIPQTLLINSACCYAKAKERIRELERLLESLQKKLGESEDKSNKMYLHMYAKEQEAGPSTSAVSEIALMTILFLIAFHFRINHSQVRRESRFPSW